MSATRTFTILICMSRFPRNGFACSYSLVYAHSRQACLALIGQLCTCTIGYSLGLRQWLDVESSGICF